MSKCSMAKKIESLTQNEAAGNSVSNFSRNSLGVSFDGKFGTMRKPADWVIYPTKPEDKTFDIQCDNRWATIEKETGKMLLSAPHSFANSWVLANDVRTGKAQRITLEPEVLKQLLDAISDRRITDHSLDKIVRSADVTDAEIRGESKGCSMKRKIESLGKKNEAFTLPRDVADAMKLVKDFLEKNKDAIVDEQLVSDADAAVGYQIELAVNVLTDLVANAPKGEAKQPEAKKSEAVDDSKTIKMNVDYNTFMRLCSTAAYLTSDEDYWDALWDFYSEVGNIGDALVFFDNLFQYTAWKDVDETYDELDESDQDGSKSKEECIKAVLDRDGEIRGSLVQNYGDYYLWVY